MSVRLKRIEPRKSSADGLKENVLAAIIQHKKVDHDENEESELPDNISGPTIWKSDGNISIGAENELNLKRVLDTSLRSNNDSLGSKRNLHSSRLTLEESREFYKSIGIRWLKALRKGDVKSVKSMLEEKPELVHYSPLYGPHAIHIATARADRSILLLLVAKGVDVNIRDTAGYTPLQIAVLAGNVSLGHFLIGQGADHLLYDPEGLQICDYDAWSSRDNEYAQKNSIGKSHLREKSRSFIESPPGTTSTIRPSRPMSTPDTVTSSSQNSSSGLKRDGTRNSWKSFFDKNAIHKNVLCSAGTRL